MRQTTVPGVYAAGDVASMQRMIVAAATGAAATINGALVADEVAADSWSGRVHLVVPPSGG